MTDLVTVTAPGDQIARCAIGTCDHVLCHPQTPPPRTQPIALPPSTGWRDRLDAADVRAARAARLAAQARGFGLQRDLVLPADRIPNGCGCPNPADGMLPHCYWTGEHTPTAWPYPEGINHAD